MSTTEHDQLMAELAELRAELAELRADLFPIVELFANLQRGLQSGAAGGPLAMLRMLQTG
jgi:hypothetical protein